MSIREEAVRLARRWGADELDAAAIDAARFNAERHGVSDRCTFFAADAGEAFRKLAESYGLCRE